MLSPEQREKMCANTENNNTQLTLEKELEGCKERNHEDHTGIFNPNYNYD